MRLLILFLISLISFGAYSQTNGRFERFFKEYSYNNVTIQHVFAGYEETKKMAVKIRVDSKNSTVAVEMGNERPRHYIISTPGINRKLELGNEKVFSFRLSPVIGKGDYMFFRPDWAFVVLMIEEEGQIYIFKNVDGASNTPTGEEGNKVSPDTASDKEITQENESTEEE